MKNRSFLLLAGLLFLVACHAPQKPEEEKSNELPAALQTVLDKTLEQFRPDKRLAVFNTEFTGDTLRIETDMPEARDFFQAEAAKSGANIPLLIKNLPDETVGENKYAIIKVSVANLRSGPHYSEEMGTQATLGTIIKILKIQENGWWYIQSPDGYLSWIFRGAVLPLTDADLAKIRAAERHIFLPVEGTAFAAADRNSAPVSDLVFGNVLEKIGSENGFTKVRFPDAREAFVPAEEMRELNDWYANSRPVAEKLVRDAQKLSGRPYLWGGTSTKGMDCSGFTRTVYAMNGLLIPRDASQQVREGRQIETADKNFEKLEAGDLLFFGRAATDSTTERVVHVGMWIGDMRFIHSSGMVRISSMDKNAPDFDESEYNRFLRAKRYINEESKGLKAVSTNF